MLLRVLLAVISVVVFWMLLPPVLRVIGFPLDADLLLIVRVIVAASAVYYIIWGKPVIA